jgi:hypothetical protein
MSHLGLIIGNAVRRVIGQSTEEELPRPRASRQRPSARRPGSLRLELNLKGEVLFRNPGVAGVVQPCPLANLAPLAFASCEIAEIAPFVPNMEETQQPHHNRIIPLSCILEVSDSANADAMNEVPLTRQHRGPSSPSGRRIEGTWLDTVRQRSHF